jgi:transcriptional regulator of heat shock response
MCRYCSRANRIRPTIRELNDFGEPDYTIYNAGSFPADPEVEGITSETSVALDFESRALVILVGEDGSVENRAIAIPSGLPPSTLALASNYLSARMQGRTIAESQLVVREELASLKSELDELAAKVVEAGIAKVMSAEQAIAFGDVA